MKCRRCSAEISDKALICYRCGTPTGDPVAVRTGRGGRSRHKLLIWVGIAALMLIVALWLFLRIPGA